MNRSEESQIREIFRKHLDEAIDEISQGDISCGYLPSGYDGRLAEIVTQAVSLMAESCEYAKQEMQGD